MDEETKQILEETLVLTKENNNMLHKVRNVQKWATFWRVVKILLVLGFALGSFYYIEPYLNKMLDLYNSISNTQQNLNGGVTNIQDLIKRLGN